MSLETRARTAAEDLRAATTVDPETGMAWLRRTHRRRRFARVTAAALVVIGVAGGIGLSLDEGVRVIGPVDRQDQGLDPPSRTDGVVWAAEPGTTATRATKDEPSMTLPRTAELLKDPRTDPLPAWSAFDQATGRFLWTDLSEVGVGYVGPRTIIVSTPDAGSGPVRISCVALCSDVVSFGPGPDEVTVLVMDTMKDPVDPGPESIARVYGLDGSVRTDIDLAAVMGSERRVSAETDDWVPPDGSEALIADIAWAPDGSRLAVSTHPGFFEPECPPAGLPCNAEVWTFDRDGGDPVLVHRQPAHEQQRDRHTPTLTDLAWTTDGSRLGMVLASDSQHRAARPPRLVVLDVESGRASTLHEFDACGSCRPAPFGFAWSPEGTRLAVTSGDGVSVLDADGTVLTESSDGGHSPLAWLVEAP